VDIALKVLHLGAFLAIDDYAIRAEHSVQDESADDQDGQHGGQSAPFAREPRPLRTRSLDPTAGCGFGTRRLLHHYANAVFRTRQDPRSRKRTEPQIAGLAIGGARTF